jgi:diguanylate cyclase (GGDEF)-like protein/PAS domain S-box-containing protein
MKNPLLQISRFWSNSIRRQLIAGIVLVHAVMMSIFVYDLVSRQREFLHEQLFAQTESLAQSLAVTSVSWLLANDVAGMQEVVVSLSKYPGVNYAMLIQKNGRVAAHSDASKIGLFLNDPASLRLMRSHAGTDIHPQEHGESHSLRNDRQLIDLAVPVISNKKLIGWARVAISQDSINAGLGVVLRNGMLYTLAAIAIGMFFASLMGARLTKGLNAVAGVADAFRRGERNLRVEIIRGDEIGHLADGFNTMLNVVSNREAALAASEERFDLAMRGSNDGLWDWNLRTNQVYFSPRWKSMIGYGVDEITNDFETWRNHLHPDDISPTLQAVDDYVAGKTENYEVEFRLRHKDGHYVWILARGITQRDETGKPIRLVGTHTDLSERKRLESMLRLDASVLDSAQEGVLITDADYHVIRVNRAFTQLTGYEPNEILGKNPSILSSGLHDAAFYTRMWESIENSGSWRGEIWNRKKNGDVYAEILSITTIRDAQGHIENYVGLFTDITELKNTQRNLEKLANFDLLTGLPNRSLLADRLQQAIAAARRQNRSLAVCFLDLDGFKEINDHYGHDVGDELLIEVARRLTSAVRGSDTVARLGGDEFVLLLENSGGDDELDITMCRVLQDIYKPFFIAGQNLGVSASIGVALYPKHQIDPDVLIRYADQAMYIAKQSGRNRYHLFDVSHDQETQSRYQLVGRLQQAMQQGELRLHYQPKVNMRDGQIIGHEALLRWQHPDRGIVPPAEFLPLIEDNDLMIEIGEWVVRAALKQISIWITQDTAFPVSVNIAGRQLQQPDFVERLQQALADYPDVSPSMLELEVLESAIIEDIGQVRTTLLRCREMGVSVAIDDFGTGYSSLSYLKHLPADVLKIDRSFIRDLLDDEDDLDIARGVIGLGEVFHRTVVAEGVETTEHGVLLLKMGCNIGQGYGIARPMPPEDIPAWIQNFNPDVAWKLWSTAQWDMEDYPLLLGQHDHLKWISQILQSVEIKPMDALLGDLKLDKQACRFGAWYSSRGQEKFASLSTFQEIDSIHTRIHAIGDEIVRLYESGKIEEAMQQRGNLVEASDQFIRKLAELQQTIARNAPNSAT